MGRVVREMLRGDGIEARRADLDGDAGREAHSVGVSRDMSLTPFIEKNVLQGENRISLSGRIFA